MKQRIALLGSTGSIGCQTLDILRRHPDVSTVETLTAARSWQTLAAQAREFEPDSVAIADKSLYPRLKDALADLPVKVYAGDEAVRQVAGGGNVDVVVNAIVGYAGLAPTVQAVRAGKKLALANKESLVVAGETVMRLAAENKAPIIPIDSEHSAILQCLVGEPSPVRRLIITASGGALRDLPASELASVTPARALRHPNWNMGAKITIDSATLVNKGFEVIEAHHLFGLPADKIDVTLHAQSVVHSMVEFEDGAIKAQMGIPDMRLPIQYALFFPQRPALEDGRFEFGDFLSLTFEPVDRVKYPALDIAYDCLRRSGNRGCVMNAANEVAVAAFLEQRIGFTDIVRTIEHALCKVPFASGMSLDDFSECDAQSRAVADEFVSKIRK